MKNLVIVYFFLTEHDSLFLFLYNSYQIIHTITLMESNHLERDSSEILTLTNGPIPPPPPLPRRPQAPAGRRRPRRAD